MVDDVHVNVKISISLFNIKFAQIYQHDNNCIQIHESNVF